MNTATQAPAINPWREAVLDQLAIYSLDCEVTEPPASVIKRLLEVAVHMAQDQTINEPAEYQYRTKPNWVDGLPIWIQWRHCSPDVYADFVKSPRVNEIIYDVRKLYAQKPHIPPGYQLAPIEPTQSMVYAGQLAEEAWRDSDDPDNGLAVIYRAMLAAAKETS